MSDVPGTTRDAHRYDLRVYRKRGGRKARKARRPWKQEVTLIDTAGIRRRGRIEPGVERYSVIRTLRAIQRADITLLVIDATEGITAQDTHIAGYVLEESRGMVLVVNKWGPGGERLQHDLRLHRPPASGVELHAVCAVRFHIGQVRAEGQTRCLPIALEVAKERAKRVSTGSAEQADERGSRCPSRRPPSRASGSSSTMLPRPTSGRPTFVFFTNDADSVHFLL